jgi:adenine-specific DNA-methyltransferase
MRYFGSKSSTVQSVLNLALAARRIRTAADAFGGLGTIGASLRQHNIHVTTCDVLAMPHAFQHSRISCSTIPSYRRVRRHLNLSSRDALLTYLRQRRNLRSWLVREFATERMFFTKDNAAQIAGAWDEIRRWNDEGLLSVSERSHLIASLIDSVDACANTAGTYYAHLKQWDRKALRPFSLSFMPIPSGLPRGQALRGDALESLRGQEFDLLYLDPPYNGRDYARYYHLPESLARLRRPSTNPNSLAGLPKSIGNESLLFRQAIKIEYLQMLVEQVGWKRLVVQYCSDGLIPIAELRASLKSYGFLNEHKIEALGYTTKSQQRRYEHHVFIVDRKSRRSS